MYYSGFNVSTNEYLIVGRNSKTKKECVDDIWNFIMEGEEKLDLEDNIDDISRELEVLNYSTKDKETHLWQDNLVEIIEHKSKIKKKKN